jgi:hypothetical protein
MRSLEMAEARPDAVTGRVKSGWLRKLHRGVYLVGPREVPLTRAMAAVAAYGDAAVLSHRPAAVLWGLCPPPAGVMHVTVSGRAAHGRDGIEVHRSTLDPQDATERERIPVTSPARTLLDLATVCSPRELGPPQKKPKSSGSSHPTPSPSSSRAPESTATKSTSSGASSTSSSKSTATPSTHRAVHSSATAAAIATSKPTATA